MSIRDLLALAVWAAPLAACVTPVHRESAARHMSWPTDGPNTLAAARPAVAFPSVGGDILKGTSPRELAAARAASSQALTEALAKP